MKSDTFRKNHILQILEQLQSSLLPLDTTLRKYFFLHKSIGSKDRKVISETIYGIIRWQGLIDEIAKKPLSSERRLETFATLAKLEISSLNAQDHVKVSFPKILFHKLAESLGYEETKSFCLTSNEKAPIFIRTNLLKISRDNLLEKLRIHVEASPCVHSESGILLKEKINLLGLEEYKLGFFEIQDEASQLVAHLASIKPKSLVLDYCAGSGGKSLAIAAKMGNKGQIYLHDIRSNALSEAKKRLKRAGVQNAQILEYTSPLKEKLTHKFDFVIIDAPCSGSGTYRRNPDMKWRFTLEGLEELIQMQRKVFHDAFFFCKQGGEILYATCSILKDENQKQIEYFLKNYPVELQGNFFQTTPKPGEMDGFFGAVLKVKNDPKIPLGL